jgi:hypothetical protein
LKKKQGNENVLCDQVGLFEAIDSDHRFAILLQYLGRDMKIVVPWEETQACA